MNIKIATRAFTVGTSFWLFGLVLTGCSADADQAFEEINEPIVATKTVWSSLLPDSRGRDHFYSDNPAEFNLNNGWVFEMARFSVRTGSGGGSVKLRRYWNARISDHFYTTDALEGQKAVSIGYVDETNTPGYDPWVYTTQVSGTCPVYRLWSKEGKEDHFYTMSPSERDAAVSLPGCGFPCYPYKYEGIAFYAYPYNQPNCPQ